jgi:hypothetical protein
MSRACHPSNGFRGVRCKPREGWCSAHFEAIFVADDQYANEQAALDWADRKGSADPVGTQRPFLHCWASRIGGPTMRKLALAVVAVAALSTATVAPAEARWGGGWHGGGWHGGWGPGIGFGLAAGALALGAAAASPYYYGPGYAYGPRYYRPGPYAYYGGPVYYGPRYFQPYYRPCGYW